MKKYTSMMYPILYSFRRCPYAIRARMAIRYSSVKVELREVLLRDKPEAMLKSSPKGTVPVLLLPDGNVIDESLDIMLWALSIRDPDAWLGQETRFWEGQSLLTINDADFKRYLDRYKYADRYPEHPVEYYRFQACKYLQQLEVSLARNRFLCGAHISLMDVAIFPFIRQFAFVDKKWFDESSYPHLQAWLNYFLASSLFAEVMLKYPRWFPGDDPIIF